MRILEQPNGHLCFIVLMVRQCLSLQMYSLVPTPPKQCEPVNEASKLCIIIVVRFVHDSNIPRSHYDHNICIMHGSRLAVHLQQRWVPLIWIALFWSCSTGALMWLVELRRNPATLKTKLYRLEVLGIIKQMKQCKVQNWYSPLICQKWSQHKALSNPFLISHLVVDRTLALAI